MRGCDELKRKPITKDVSAVVQLTPKLLPPRIYEGEATSIDNLCRQIHQENVETLTKVYIALKFFKFQ